MTIYYCLILWVGLVSLFSASIKGKQKRNIIAVGLCGFGIFIIQALRSDAVGIDISGYITGYHLASNINVFAGARLFNYEVGYILYSQVFSKLGISSQWYLAIVALTIIGPLSYVWYKNSKMPGLSIFIYITLGFFTFSFSGLRQSIAMAIIFFGFKYIQERHLVKFILCVALATTFHTTAIISLAAYPLYSLRLKPAQLVLMIPPFIMAFIFRSQIFLLIYRLYKGVAGEVESTNAYTMLIVMILVFVLACIFGNKDKLDLKFNAYKNYMLVAIFVQLLASQSNAVMRAGYYYYLFTTLLIPEVIKNQKDAVVRTIAVNLLIVALLYFFYTTTGNGYLNVSPYHFYWE
jgi:hypothetical protein